MTLKDTIGAVYTRCTQSPTDNWNAQDAATFQSCRVSDAALTTQSDSFCDKHLNHYSYSAT